MKTRGLFRYIFVALTAIIVVSPCSVSGEEETIVSEEQLTKKIYNDIQSASSTYDDMQSTSSTHGDTTQASSADDRTYSTTKKPRIVVIDFENTNKFAKDRGYGATVAAMIATALTKNANVLLVENKEIKKKIKNELKADAELAQYEQYVEVVVHGAVSLIEEKGQAIKIIGKDGKAEVRRKPSRLIVDLRIADLKKALTSKNFDVKDFGNLRDRVEKNVNEFIVDYLRPYSGHVELLISGYRQCSDDADPRTIYDTFFSKDALKIDKEGVELSYRPLQETIINEKSKPDSRNTTDNDYDIIGDNFFRTRVSSSDIKPNHISGPMIAGAYRFRLKIPGYKTIEEDITITAGGEPQLLNFDVKIETAALIHDAGQWHKKEEGFGYMIVLNGKEKWNGKEIALNKEEYEMITKIDDNSGDAQMRKCLCEADFEREPNDSDEYTPKKKLRLIWKPHEKFNEAKYDNKKESGYGYLPKIRSKIEGESYIIEKLPVGRYRLVTIPTPKKTYGHFILNAFMYQKEISIHEGKENREQIVGKAERGTETAIVFLDPFKYGTLIRDVATLRFRKTGYGTVSYGDMGKIHRYGEIILTGLEKDGSYAVIINSKNYQETIEIPKDCEKYKECLKRSNTTPAQCREESYPCFINAELKSKLSRKIKIKWEQQKRELFIRLIEENIDNSDPVSRMDAINALLSIKKPSEKRSIYTPDIVKKAISNLTTGDQTPNFRHFEVKYCKVIKNAADADKEAVYSNEVIMALKKLIEHSKSQRVVDTAKETLKAVEDGKIRLQAREEKKRKG